MRSMRHIVICGLPGSTVSYHSILKNGTFFGGVGGGCGGGVIEQKIRVVIFFTISV